MTRNGENSRSNAQTVYITVPKYICKTLLKCLCNKNPMKCNNDQMSMLQGSAVYVDAQNLMLHVTTVQNPT